jgi:aquaporin Z
MNEFSLSQRMTAEFLGTFWLVFGGCGSAVLAAAFPNVGIGLLGVALAFGLSVLTMAYAVGHVSGGHFNPAVTVGLCTARRFLGRDVIPYVGAQVAGAIAGFAANGYDAYSPGGYSLVAALVAELICTFFFLIVILGATDKRSPQALAGVAIGLALTLIHLVSIPVTNTSVNPARSTGPAIFVGGWALKQLWLFWLAPIIGAALGGVAYRFLAEERKASEPAFAQTVTP